MSNQANFFSDIYELSIGGPSILTEQLLPAIGIDLPGSLTFFATGQISLTDGYTKLSASQIQSSIVNSDFWSPDKGTGGMVC